MINIPRKTAQQIVDTVKDVCGFNINFMNDKGIILASTDPARIGTFHEGAWHAIESGTVLEVSADDLLSGTQQGVNVPVSQNGQLAAVIGISGDPDEVRTYARLAERITRLILREQELNAAIHTTNEKRNYLLRSLLSEERNPDSYTEDLMEEFHLRPDTEKRAILFRLRREVPASSLSLVENRLFSMFRKIPDSIIGSQYPGDFPALVGSDVFDRFRPMLEQFLEEESALVTAGVGSSEPVPELPRSYRTAKTALESLSHGNASFALFDDLTLEILLGSISSENRKEYLNRVLSGLSGEDIRLLTVYFEEEQSLAKTCSRLFLHKNTLQYKLDRIHRICGFNPRRFSDAVILSLAVRLS